ncbi:MAG TPA: amino acid ABC transporter permease [Anaerolineae bacterium]|nr:amino acid ABC transporter permease [Anaerolineae bacterium]
MSAYQFDFSVVLQPENLAVIARGLIVTLILTAITSAIAVLLGWIGAAVTTSGRGPLRSLVCWAIEIFRNVPALVQVFFWSFAFPLILPRDVRVPLLFDNPLVSWLQSQTGVHAYYFAALVMGLSLNTAAYLADIFRAGIESVGEGQIAAALASGLTQRQVMREIVFPQALHVSFPALTTRLVHTMKNTALGVFVPVPELMSALLTATSRTFRALEFLVAGAALYLAIGWAESAILARIDRRRTPWAIAESEARWAR